MHLGSSCHVASRATVWPGRPGVWRGCLGPVPVTHDRAPPSLVEPSQGGFESVSGLVVARHPRHTPGRSGRTAPTRRLPWLHRQRMSRRETASKTSVSASVMTRIMTSAQAKTIWVARISRL